MFQQQQQQQQWRINILSRKANDIDIFLHKYQSSSEATHFKGTLIDR